VKRQILPASAVVVALLLTLWAVAAPLPQAVASTTLQLTRNERALIAGINHERAKRGLHTLRVRVSLMRAARSHSRDMARQRYLGHCSSSGESFANRLVRLGYSRCGCRVWRAGENVARGWAGSVKGTPQWAVSAWMRSSVHRRVILTASFRDIGVGIYRASGSHYRYFTLDLGRRIRY
jgi:uncharacterized protein YkwD